MRTILCWAMVIVIGCVGCSSPVTVVPVSVTDGATAVVVPTVQGPTATVSPLPRTATPIPATLTPIVPTATPIPATLTPIVPTATLMPARTQQHVQATVSAHSAYTYVFPVVASSVHYGSIHHDYMATDIFCDDGSQFVAVIDGVVDDIEATDQWDPAVDDPATRSGLAVAIIGVDGNRYYGSHLRDIAAGLTVGMPVTAGQLLGYTGRSGNARQTPPHLHFGISRPSYPADWQVRRGEMNPYEFLQAWEKGEALQPLFLP